jgi:hypothetical protein
MALTLPPEECKMKSVEKKIAFYGALVELIRDEEFVTSSAEALVQLFEEIKSDVSIGGVTLEFLTDIWGEYHDDNRELDLMETLTETAFKDLARHMRSPEVRRIFKDFSNMSGTSSQTDLFVYTANVRTLSDFEGGISVVTLVVDDLTRLQDLLNKNDTVEVIHSV